MSCRARHDHSCGRLPLPRVPFGALPILLLSFSSLSGQSGRIQKISATEGGFDGVLRNGDAFGTSIVSLGDLDGDGVTDIAVGAPSVFDITQANRGSVWILFLNRDGTVKDARQIRIDDPSPGPMFGIGLGMLGDFDGDGLVELEVSSVGRARFGGTYRLAINRDGSAEVRQYEEGKDRRSAIFSLADSLIATGTSFDPPEPGKVFLWSNRGGPLLDVGTELGFSPDRINEFGFSLTGISFGNEQALVVGEPDFSLVYLFQFEFVRSSTRIVGGRLRHWQSISPWDYPLIGIDEDSWFGAALAGVGDLDGDEREDLIVGAPRDRDGDSVRGALWMLFLNTDGSVNWYDKLSSATRPELGVIGAGSRFGSAIASLGDLDGDGFVDVAVGAPGDDDGGQDRGAAYILFNLNDTKPTIALASPPANPIPSGTALEIEANVTTSLSGLSEVELVFSRGGDSDEFSARMNETAPGQYSGVIPAFAVNERGVEYHLSVKSRRGLETRLPESGFFSARVRLPDGLRLAAPGGGLAEGYRLVSVPLTLDRPSASSVFQDDLGPYDPARWRLYGSNQVGLLTEFGDDSLTIEPGKAFWLLVKDRGASISTGSGTSVRTDQPFRIPLWRGWNLVANPFAFDIPVSNVSLRSGAPADLLTYDGSWESVDFALVPFAGYIVFADVGGDTLVVDPNMRHATSGKRLDGGSADLGSELEWSIRVKAEKGRARDVDNLLGVSYRASDEWDALDRPEPPMVWDYVSVYFPHEEWGKKNEMFRTDIKSAECGVRGAIDAAACSWTFGVSAASRGEVDLTFEGVETAPSELGVWLYDPATAVWQDLRLDHTYRVVVPGTASTDESRSSARSLEIHVGPAGEHPPIERPVHGFELLSFPNPFARSVTITYGLSKAAEVSVSVFNALGQRVVQLVDNVPTSAGGHTIVWEAVSADGQLLAPGMYIVRLHAGSVTESRVVTLSR